MMEKQPTLDVVCGCIRAEAKVEAALAELAASAEYGDIASCAASNGDRFVYSNVYLTSAHAERLAEWIAVEEKENP